jgi:thiamine biosynthesis lipoprotein
MKKHNLSRVLCGILILLLCTLASCAPAKHTATVAAMDTVMTMTVYGDKAIADRLCDKAAGLDAALSTTDSDSEIARLNRDGAATLGDETAALVERSLALCGELDGAFDISVYPAVRAWGFTTGDYRVPDADELKKLAASIDCRRVALDGSTVTLPDGMMIDLGAVAKGYLADISRDILGDSGASCAVLNLGGTILLYGKKSDNTPFSVGIADPDAPASYFGTLSLDSGVVSTSGGYERYFERDGRRYIHILDPSTAAPVDNGVLSVTVVCDEGVRADALSTALFVMGADRAAAYYKERRDFECAVLTDDNTLLLTEGLADRFTLCDGYDISVAVIR